MKKFLIEDLAKIIKAHEPRLPRAGSRGAAPAPSGVEGSRACPERGRGERRFLTGVSTDSRTIRTGDCFFAIAGEKFDGHDYVLDAFAGGAVCAVVNTQYAIRNTQYEILKVGDTIRALGDFARQYRQQGNFKVIAITGSVGKTTTRQIAHHVLSQHFPVFQAPSNFNNNIGLPLTLLGAACKDKIIIAEIGSNCPGEVAYLTRIAMPDVAIVTNVYPAHLDGLRDMQTIIHEKLSISEGLRGEGSFIINADFDQLVSTCRAKGIRYTSFGKSDRCDIRVQNITQDGLTSRFTVDGTRITLPLPGRGNVENALAAWAVCSQFGLDINDFSRAIKTVPTVPMRAELLQIGTLTVLSDCYNANPASMKNALDILVDIGSAKKRRLVFICGYMAELGEQTEQLHAELGSLIAQAKVQLLLAVGKFAQIAAEAAKKNADYDLQAECFEDTLLACNNLHEFIKDYDIILIKGSRVAKLEIVVEKLKELFS